MSASGEAECHETTPGKADSSETATAPAAFSRMFALGAMVVVIALALTVFFMQAGKDTALERDPYLLSYSLLHANKAEDARRGFESLPEDDSRKFEGLSAVFFEKGDYDSALEMSNKSLEIAPYNLYALVIKGNILFSLGKMDEALKKYEKAVSMKDGLRWQKAEALNGIARIYSERGETEKAVEFYGRAAQLNPESSEIFTNYGVAMQRMGDNEKAVSSFRKAAKINPQDQYSSVLFAQAFKNQQDEQDGERQQRIDKLVNEIAEKFKKPISTGALADQWTSRPVVISFLDFKSRGAPSLR